jgi:predicted transposase/invertase (TIGR01784 family)
MYDNVCKFLAEHYSQDFAQWLLGIPIGLTQLSPSELSISPIRADALILLTSDPIILHLEFQTQADADIPFRMIDYRLRVYRRYPEKAMRQVVIYLTPTQSERVYQTTFELPGTRHEFEVVRLWEVPVTELLRSPGLLPLAILSRTDDKTATLQQVAQQIEGLSNPVERNNVAAATFILSGLVLEKAVIQQILREELVKESVTYQDILQKGVQQGLQAGRQEGLQAGRQEGLQRELDLVIRQLQRRFGPLEPIAEAQVRSLPIDQLESLGEALLDFTQPDDLVDWLDQND